MLTMSVFADSHTLILYMTLTCLTFYIDIPPLQTLQQSHVSQHPAITDTMYENILAKSMLLAGQLSTYCKSPCTILLLL